VAGNPPPIDRATRGDALPQTRSKYVWIDGAARCGRCLSAPLEPRPSPPRYPQRSRFRRSTSVTWAVGGPDPECRLRGRRLGYRSPRTAAKRRRFYDFFAANFAYWPTAARYGQRPGSNTGCDPIRPVTNVGYPAKRKSPRVAQMKSPAQVAGLFMNRSASLSWIS
jgi:hypothetical protein